jgi:hypothetical protein
MVVDFEFAKSPSLRVATYAWKGPWDEKRIRREFEKVAKWASGQRLRTGRWLLNMPDTGRFSVAIEIRGRPARRGGIRVRTLPASRIARVRFNPDELSPRVVYHGLTDWLRWRKREKKITHVGVYREVYADNPWSNARAWAATEVQVLVR